MNLRRYLHRIIKHETRALRQLVREQKWLALTLVVGLVALIIAFDPIPPKKLIVATGEPGSSYMTMANEIGKNFRANGIRLAAVPSEGSVDSARMLLDKKSPVNVALIQGGALDAETAKQLLSLGSIGYEPVWVFYRKDLQFRLNDLRQLGALRVGVGPETGGTLPVVRDLMRLSGVDMKQGRFKTDSYAANVAELEAGTLDAIVQVSPIYDPEVQQLLRNKKLALLDMNNAEAYVQHLDYLKVVHLPAESVDIAARIPAHSVSLLATTTQIVIRPNMHPDLQMLFLISLKNVFRTSLPIGFFAKSGEFPNYVDASIPESAVATRFYERGKPVIWQYLPVWAAGIVDRMWVFLVGLFAVIYPLSRIRFHFRSASFNLLLLDLYEELLVIENILTQGTRHTTKRVLLEKLEQINLKALANEIPIGSEINYFQLINAIEILRNRIERLKD